MQRRGVIVVVHSMLNVVAMQLIERLLRCLKEFCCAGDARNTCVSAVQRCELLDSQKVCYFLMRWRAWSSSSGCDAGLPPRYGNN